MGVIKAYCDGGMIGPKNPCKYGGTWAYVIVGEKGIIAKGSGLILCGSSSFPYSMITNNQSEYYAAMRLFRQIGRGEDVSFHTDSLVTIRRIFGTEAFSGIPQEWILNIVEDIKRLGVVTPVHVKGHPTLKDIKNGSTKTGKPVSAYNCLCDRMCRERAEQWKSINL